MSHSRHIVPTFFIQQTLYAKGMSDHATSKEVLQFSRKKTAFLEIDEKACIEEFADQLGRLLLEQCCQRKSKSKIKYSKLKPDSCTENAT